MGAANEIVIIGGGVIGLAIAVDLKLRGTSVTVLSRDSSQAASHAAAGMLAPRAEKLTPPMLDLCLQSLALYPEWISKLEDLSGISAGYWACGILAPVYAPVANPPQSSDPTPQLWLDQTAIRQAQPGLSEAVSGGWWFPEEGQVDNRLLVQALRLAAESLGVDIQEGIAVTDICQQQGQVTRLKTTAGDRTAAHYVLATGAWSQALLPVPVQPHKGQMLSVQVPQPSIELPLQRVLYGEETYIVPRRDGKIVIGATSEAVGFTPYNTPAGLQTLLNAAIRLYPALGNMPIHECWWGFRPATPDELPILGASLCENLTLATGHYRNGILLAPITAKLIGDRICSSQANPLLTAFSWQRFHTSTPSHPYSSTPPMLQYSSPVETPPPNTPFLDSDRLTIAGRPFRSRLMTGTGKYRNFEQMQQSVAASGCEIVTVAVRRVQTNAPGHEGLAEAIDWGKIWMLPNTAGCQTAEDAIRVARLGREMAKLLGQEDNNFVKLEVIPDAKYLLPDPIGTLEAAEKLVKEGFAVLPYINADPLLAKRLEEVGCATVMPLGSPIGSGQGIKNTANIQIIIENAKVPVVVDAGIGTPSEAAQAMEMGADALLVNTAIAQAQDPAAMAKAMGLATTAGRLAYLAGRIPVKDYASASSPLTGTITS
ncbi:glycine oxidase ThiO [Phormidium tenue FACHB-886]|nr:glycine oxidase ThiO [Phormidium tenue FACHB-886]